LDFGFEKNPYDSCVFNKMMYGKQCTVVIHVDDLKISCADPRGVVDTLDELRRVYKEINVFDGAIIDYLGMDFNYEVDGVVKISMPQMVASCIEDLEVTDTSRVPAAPNLFQIDGTSPLLEPKRKEQFHSIVAKMLYMSKRARPDILTAVAFLTTRVTHPTEEDFKKLIKIGRYLKGTTDYALHLTADEHFVINSFIDASFACHPDMMSHTGQFTTLGGAAITTKSSKQRLVTKSSTEAELVGLSDGLTNVLWVKNFIECQGYDTGAAIIHQDNKSTITLAEKGKSVNNRTRHVSIRYFFVRDRIASGEIKIQYTGTENMVADFFSKPLQGNLFEKHRKTIMNLPE
jgi:hypothetical protein